MNTHSLVTFLFAGMLARLTLPSVQATDAPNSPALAPQGISAPAQTVASNPGRRAPLTSANYAFSWASNDARLFPSNASKSPPLRQPYNPPLAQAKPPLLAPTLPPKVIEPGAQKHYSLDSPLTRPTLPPQTPPRPILELTKTNGVLNVRPIDPQKIPSPK